MFAVLQPEPYRRRFAERFRAPKQIRVSRVTPPGGLAYIILHVPHCGAFEWPRVVQAAGRLPLLLPQGTDVPDGVGVFTPKRLPLICAAGTAADTLRGTARPARTISLGVLDRDGALCGYTAMLLPAAGDVRIVTSRPALFDGDVHKAMTQWGAALTVSDDPSLLCACTDLVCVSASSLPFGVRAERVFCLDDPCALPGAVVLSGFLLPETYVGLLPDGVDSLIFGAALYELCGVGALAACRFTQRKPPYHAKQE